MPVILPDIDSVPIESGLGYPATPRCASLLLANGIPLKQIQEWLGHSDFSTTANIYAHLDYTSKITSAQAMENGMLLPSSNNFGSRWENIINTDDMENDVEDGSNNS